MNSNLNLAIKAAIDAGKEIIKIYELSDIEVEKKEDSSPLTKADKKSNDVISTYLQKTEYPIISEESKQTDFSVRKKWKTFWIVDPLDGTKEFIKKNGEFTVNIALCKNGRAILGVIYAPASRKLYFGDAISKMAFKTVLDYDYELPAILFSEDNRIYPNLSTDGELLRIVGSRSHMNKETVTYIEESRINFQKVVILPKGSSLKFCLVAEGEADVYPRFAPTMEWDTAAGHAICSAVGINVTSQETQKDLVYNKENLLNPHFLVSK